MLLVIEHDNGICGQHGFSDEVVKTKEDGLAIVKSFEESGIFVYSISFIEE